MRLISTSISTGSFAVVNADTTYGADESIANNYGLGKQYRSAAARQSELVGKQNAPHWIWLVILLIVAWGATR